MPILSMWATTVRRKSLCALVARATCGGNYCENGYTKHPRSAGKGTLYFKPAMSSLFMAKSLATSSARDLASTGSSLPAFHILKARKGRLLSGSGCSCFVTPSVDHSV
eukprot:scaffold736_cov254-Pinguiococcus_pyrenoidosus.AAC.41